MRRTSKGNGFSDDQPPRDSFVNPGNENDNTSDDLKLPIINR